MPAAASRLVGCGSILQQVVAAQTLLASSSTSRRRCTARRRSSSSGATPSRSSGWNRLHPDETPRPPYVAQVLGPDGGPIVAASDWLKAVPDLVARWLPEPYVSLGTDGFGRSDTRESLRSFFEIDAVHIAAAVLAGLARCGDLTGKVAAKAIRDLGVDVDATGPLAIS